MEVRITLFCQDDECLCEEANTLRAEMIEKEELVDELAQADPIQPFVLQYERELLAELSRRHYRIARCLLNRVNDLMDLCEMVRFLWNHCR